MHKASLLYVVDKNTLLLEQAELLRGEAYSSIGKWTREGSKWRYFTDWRETWGSQLLYRGQVKRLKVTKY
ncbi:MAG: hypothetical protein KDD70_06555 [Bdellovibrionales bacterium]|nr:hypothetical protein [Bdellovibrionales bacterium]